MSQALKFAVGSGGAQPLYVDDVFATWLRTGTGASATITTGVDLSAYGGCVWVKSRSAATGHRLMHTSIGVGNKLVTDTTAASAAAAQGVTAVSTTGHTIGTDTDYNNSTGPATYVDWVFRNAPNFYHHATVTKSAGSNATYTFNTITTLGMVRVKRTDSTGSWYIWHRSLTAGKLLIGETTAAEATLGHITVSGQTVTLVNGVIADGTYLVEAFAHDTSADGIIQCGSYTGNGSSTGPTINLGGEPQFLLVKSAGSVTNWVVYDTMRGMALTGANTLYPNLSDAEAATTERFAPTATGFNVVSNNPNVNSGSTAYIYLTIRRPNKPPTSGTQVYNAATYAGDGSTTTGQVVSVGFPFDLAFTRYHRGGAGDWDCIDRLRGLSSTSNNTASKYLNPYSTAIEASGGYLWDANNLTVRMYGFDAGKTQLNHFFRRAPGVFDEICYIGTGANKTETIPVLGVPAELWIVKGRSGATAWMIGSSLLANTEYIICPSPNGKVTDATVWNSTYPTATALSIGTHASVNANTATYTAYLWATLAGISKVFAYTGDGGSGKVIDCGFASGARFVMIIRTTASTAQDIFIWDSVRGIIAGNDPHLSLNTTAAEVTTDDSIDPDTSGFAVNQVAATNINVNGAVYIGLAYA